MYINTQDLEKTRLAINFMQRKMKEYDELKKEIE